MIIETFALFFFILLGIVIFLAVWYFLAPNNYFFTFVKEGTAKAVVRADKFEKLLIQYKGFTFDEDWNVVPENIWVKDGIPLEWTRDNVESEVEIINESRGELIVREKTYKFSRKKGSENGADLIEEKKTLKKTLERRVTGAKRYAEPWHPFGGLRFYGLWPILDIYIYKFSWTGVTEDEKVEHKEEWLDYILLEDDIYLATINKAEDSKLLPLNLELLLTIRTINPYKALFRVHNWLEAVSNRIKPFTRSYIAKDEYNNWINKKGSLGKELMDEFKRVELLEEFEGRYGLENRAIEVKEINPPEGFLEKTLAPYLADVEKKAIEIHAKAESERIRMVYKVVQDFGDLGKLIRTLESVEKSPLAASLVVQAVPGLSEVLKGVFRKAPEEVTSQEIHELKEMVKKAMEGEK